MKINDIANLLALERILVIQKPSGSGIFTKSITPGKSDNQLVAAFLTALGSFISEMKHDTPTRGKQLLARKMEEIIGHRRFIIFLIESEHVAVAAILKEEPLDSNLLEKRLRSLTKVIEDNFKKELINFHGNLAPFEQISELLDQYLFVSLMETPWNFKPSSDNNAMTTKDVQLVRSILWDIQSRLSEKEGLYFDELTEICLKKTGVLGYLEVIESLITLIQNDELVPLNENVKIPSFDLIRDFDHLSSDDKSLGMTKHHEEASSSIMEPKEPPISLHSHSNTHPSEGPISIPSNERKIEALASEFDNLSHESESGIYKHENIPSSFTSDKIDVSSDPINQDESSFLQLITDQSTTEEISLEENLHPLESLNVAMEGQSSTTDVNLKSFFEQLRILPQADLPPSLISDILKRDIIFERLGTSNVMIDEKEGSFDQLKTDVQKLTKNAHLESILDNPVNGKLLIIDSPTNQTVIAVSVTRVQRIDDDGYLWIIARKRNQ